MDLASIAVYQIALPFLEISEFVRSESLQFVYPRDVTQKLLTLNKVECVCNVNFLTAYFRMRIAVLQHLIYLQFIEMHNLNFYHYVVTCAIVHYAIFPLGLEPEESGVTRGGN